MRVLLISLLAVLNTANAAWTHDTGAAPPWQAATSWPDRIIATVTETPSTSFAVTWRTDQTVGRAIAQITRASPDARFDLGAVTETAQTQHIDLRKLRTPEGVRTVLENQHIEPTHHHSVVFEDLEPDTLYAYRVRGAPGQWSEWIQIRTAPASGPVTLLYSGDAQQGARSHWARLIRMAHEVAPNARLHIHAGDLVQKGDSDLEWARWFDAGGFLHAQTLNMPVIGNHEHMRVFDGATGEKGPRVPTPLWRAQFTLPVETDLPAYYHERTYSVQVMDELDIFVVDSTPSRANKQDKGYRTQAAWLDRALAASDAHWKIVSMHHPYFVPFQFGNGATNEPMAKAFGPVIAKHGVDLVLVGHIHHYSRASAQPRGARQTVGEGRAVDAMFVVSAASAAQGEVYEPDALSDIGDGEVDLERLSLDRAAENTPMFQVITVDGNQLRYTAHLATGQSYDAFTLTKGDDGANTLSEGSPSYGETRLFEQNTGPYREWHDLR